MDEDFVVHALVRRLAMLVSATEAFAYAVEETTSQPQFRLLAHIRPDEHAADVLTRAREAFLELVRPCIERHKDGAIKVGVTSDGTLQFCLVTRLHDRSRLQNLRAVLGFIVPCPDLADARRRLALLQGKPQSQ